MASIDLNADMGEYQDDVQAQIEAALMSLISSCSIACGGHTGDLHTMKNTACLARLHNVSIGAHPSYPDTEGFGRRSLDIDHAMLKTALDKQVATLRAVLDEEGLPLTHVKPHGALYNDAAKDDALATLVVQAAGDAVIFGPPKSALEQAAEKNGNRFIAEGFVDRLYQKDGSLTPRSMDGAIIEDINARAAQGLSLAQGNAIAARDGTVSIDVETLCIHSDSPGALETAKAVRDRLLKDGFQIESTQPVAS